VSYWKEVEVELLKNVFFDIILVDRTEIVESFYIF